MILSSIISVITSLAARVEGYRKYRLTLRALSSLDDRELSDLGIYRGRIEEIARGALR